MLDSSVEKGGIGVLMGIEPSLDTSGSRRLPCKKTDKISHVVYPLIVEGKSVYSISRTAELDDQAITLALHHWAVFRLKRSLVRWRRFIFLSNGISVSQMRAKELFRRTLLQSAFVALSLNFSSSLYLRDILAEGAATNYRKVGRETLRQWAIGTKIFKLRRSRHDVSCDIAIHRWKVLRKRICFSTMHQVLLDRGSNWAIAKKNKCLNAIEWRRKSALRYGLVVIMRLTRNMAQYRNMMYIASTFTRELILSRHLEIWMSFMSARAQLNRHLSAKVLFFHRKKMAIHRWLGVSFARKRLLHKCRYLLRIALFYWKRWTAKSSARLLNIRGIAETLTLDNNKDHLQQYISIVNIGEHERLHTAGISVRISDMAVGIAALSRLNHLACCEKLRVAQCITLRRALRLFEKKKQMISTVRVAEKKAIAYALVAYHGRGLRQWQAKSRVMRFLKTRVEFLNVLRRRQKAVRMIQLWAEECKSRIHWCVMKAQASSMADRSCGRRAFEGWRSVVTDMRLQRLRYVKAIALGDLCLEHRIFVLFIEGVHSQQHQRSQTALSLHWWKSSKQRMVWGALVRYVKGRRSKRIQASRAAGIWHIMLLRDGAAQWALAANKAREHRLSYSIRQEKEKASRRWVLVERCARQWRKTVLRRTTQKAALTRTTQELVDGEKSFTGIHVKRSPPPSLNVPLWRGNNTELSPATLPLPPQRESALPRSMVPITPLDPVMSFPKVSSCRPAPRRPLELLFDTLDSSPSPSVSAWVIDELKHYHPHGGNLLAASNQPPSVGDKNGITADSFSQPESQTNKDERGLQWKDKSDYAHDVARVETSSTCNNNERGVMAFIPQNNWHTDELESMTMQVPHGSDLMSNVVEEGRLAQDRARLTFKARYEGLGQAEVIDKERIEENEARRLASQNAQCENMDSKPRLRDNVTKDGMTKEDDEALNRGIVDTSSGTDLPPVETEVQMINEDGSSSITTVIYPSSPCTDITDVVRDTLDSAISSAVTPRRRLQETLAKLDWWINEWQHQKKKYQEDKMHLQAIHDKFEDMDRSIQSSVLASTTEKPCDTQWSIATARSRIEDYRIFKSQATCEVPKIQNRIACLELEVLRE